MLDNGGAISAPAPSLIYVIEDRGEGARVDWLEEPVAITIEEVLRPPMDGERASVSIATHGSIRFWPKGSKDSKGSKECVPAA
jgi:hypothetical protein